MSSFRYLSSKNASAVEDLLSQAKDLYDLEQVAAINLAGFTDSALPTNLETRFRRLKSLPVSRQPDPVSRQPNPVSSSKKLLFHSKSMAEKNHKRNFSGRIKHVPSVHSRPLVSSVDGTRVFSGSIKRDQSVKSRDGKVLSPPTTTAQAVKLLSKEKSRTSSASSASIDLMSPSSSEPDQEKRSNRKPKSKLLVSWFDKLAPSRAMGCLFSPSIASSSNNKKHKNSSKPYDP
ncbi:BnaA09g29980D [Brassica napus]|uniref:BnaA09g29980D protein n=1 Tax=Brassica napus TaxID=3708 RepID=A0A078G7N7_BRANA|nr:BnaA09g29980D [Brassica napus]